jgi:uncharacterized membrane protein
MRNNYNWIYALIGFIAIVITALIFLNAVQYNSGFLQFNFNITQYHILSFNTAMFLMVLTMVIVILTMLISLVKK